MAEQGDYLNELEPVVIPDDDDEMYVGRDQGTDPDREDRKIKHGVLKEQILAGHTHAESEITDLDRVRWRYPYSLGDQYYRNDMVRDGDWTMIANRDTTERAAPQPTGVEFFAYEGVGTTSQVTAKSVMFGNRYTLQKSGYITGYRIFTVTGNHYVVYSVKDPLGVAEINTLIEIDATETGWIEFGLSPIVALAGESFDLIVEVNEPDPTPTVWSGNWSYVTTNNDRAPISGEIVHADKLVGILRVHKTDSDGVSRSAELLALDAGDIIEGAGVRWSIQSVTDDGAHMSFGIAPQSQGATGLGAFNFETVTATPITYFNDPDWWLSTTYNVKGLLGVDVDYASIVPNDSAYGADVKVQDAIIPVDWDVVALR